MGAALKSKVALDGFGGLFQPKRFSDSVGWSKNVPFVFHALGAKGEGSPVFPHCELVSIIN